VRRPDSLRTSSRKVRMRVISMELRAAFATGAPCQNCFHNCLSMEAFQMFTVADGGRRDNMQKCRAEIRLFHVLG
jgi:hypothetical protein